MEPLYYLYYATKRVKYTGLFSSGCRVMSTCQTDRGRGIYRDIVICDGLFLDRDYPNAFKFLVVHIRFYFSKPPTTAETTPMAPPRRHRRQVTIDLKEPESVHFCSTHLTCFRHDQSRSLSWPFAEQKEHHASMASHTYSR